MFIIINLKVYILGLFLCCYSVLGIFLPSTLKSKPRNSNETDLYEKVWMKYIEKRLETINMHLEKQKQITSLLDIHKRNFWKKLFRKLPANCEQLSFNNPAGIPVGLYGKICGSSKREMTEENMSIHSCSKIKLLEMQAVCYSLSQKHYRKY